MAIKAPDVDDEKRLRADLERALGELIDRAPDYQKRQDRYEGVQAEVIAHPALEKLLSRYAGDNFRITIAAVPADALCDRIDLSGLSAGDEAIDKALKAQLWEPNELDDDADDFHLKASYLGDYYAIAWPKPTDDDDDGSDANAQSTIELHGKHPTTARILYSRENSRDSDFGIFRWNAGKERWRVNVYYDDCIVQWLAEAADGTKPEQYELMTDDDGDVDVIDNPYGFPMFHWRPDSKPYGRPVNLKAYGPQDAVTKLVATHMGTVDYTGYPQRYALLDPTREEGDDIADDFNENGTLDVDPDDVVSTTNESKLKSAPGSAWLLEGVKSVGQFNPADPKFLLDPVDFYARKAAALCRIPPRYFGLDDGGNDPSGESRRREDQPLVKHADKVKGTFGRTWSSIGAFCLKVWSVGAGKTVEPNWLPAETATDKEGIELVGLKIEHGVPPRQALLEAGYTTEQVDEWLPEGDDDSEAMALTPALIVKLAQALQQLGQAKTLGTVTDDQLATILGRYLPAVEGGVEPQPAVPAAPAVPTPTLAPPIPPAE